MSLITYLSNPPVDEMPHNLSKMGQKQPNFTPSYHTFIPVTWERIDLE